VLPLDPRRALAARAGVHGRCIGAERFLLEHKKLLGYPRWEEPYTRPEHLRCYVLFCFLAANLKKRGEPTSGLEPLTCSSYE